MSRRAVNFEAIDSLLAGPSRAQPAQALLVARGALIRFLKQALGHMHDLRYDRLQTPGAQDDLPLIKYWEDVLAWVKECRSDDLFFMERRK